MRTVHFDKKYNFAYFFNTKTGEYIRTGILDKDGNDTGVDPFMASYPHLLDVGIMGRCAHGRSGFCMASGIECYQDGPGKQLPNMSLEDFERICRESRHKSNEFALGGRGDPDQHENFKEILETCVKFGIVPNFTTSGLGITKGKAELCKKYCGAVAVSMYSRLQDLVPFVAMRKRSESEDKVPYKSIEDIPVRFTFGNVYDDCRTEDSQFKIDNKVYRWEELHHLTETDMNGKYELFRVFEEKQSPNYTIKAIDVLMSAGVKTNIHYVLNTETIDEAMIRLKYNGFPKGINAVVFLLHKPAGLGTKEKMLNNCPEKVAEFFKMIDESHFDFKIGFDSCTVPGLLNNTTHILPQSIDTCEGGRYSCYIGADMIMVPCSFDQDKHFACDLKTMSIEEAWNSPQFDEFRSYLRNSCPNCNNRESCMGGCPLMPDAVLCERKH